MYLLIGRVHQHGHIIQDDTGIRYVLDAIEEERAVAGTWGHHSQIIGRGPACYILRWANLNVV